MKLNIGYFADGPWSHNAFEKLINDKDIIISFICVRADTKDKILKDYCNKYNISYLKNENINSEEFISEVSKYNCDIFVSMSFNQIFKKTIINLPKYKTINCHAGKLPFYRGRNILNWALINDEKSFGITVHYVDNGIDTGDIILQKDFLITDEDNYSTLLDISYVECANILYEAILMFKEPSVKTIKQKDIHSTGFYCSQRKIGDEILKWNQSSRNIFNFVRSISNPGPKARAFINNKEMKINKVDYIKDAPKYKCIIGAILNKKKDGFLVKTEDTFIYVSEFEYDGKFKVGDRFELK
ncbi:MAG: formyl transferase [Arcobacter sp.]|nr:MAG: formyl transferase [Arcobacter sp.]